MAFYVISASIAERLLDVKQRCRYSEYGGSKVSLPVKCSASTRFLVPEGIDGEEDDPKAGGGRHGDVAIADANSSRLLTLAEKNVASKQRLEKRNRRHFKMIYLNRKRLGAWAARRCGMNEESMS